jgi:hypothetical protein
MPTFDFYYWNKDFGNTLLSVGPIIPVEVSMPSALQEFLTKENVSIPAPQVGYALIDTGASITAIDETVLKQLSILPIDSIPSQTPHGAGRSFVYPTKVSLPSINVKDFSIARVIGCNLKWKTADEKEIIMLLGRDMLGGSVLIYNGKSASITLAF